MKTRSQQLSQIIQRVQSRLLEQAQNTRSVGGAAESLSNAMEDFFNAVVASGASEKQAIDALLEQVQGFIERYQQF